MWHEFLCIGGGGGGGGGVNIIGQNTAQRDENNLSMASWFIPEVCSL